MGRASRRKRDRRRAAALAQEGRGEPLRILTAIHQTIQNICHESPRRCWEYLLEMMAHSSGWDTESCESKHLWDKMQNENRWTEFMESWFAEIEDARINRTPFSEPIGQLLERVEGTNESLAQFFTPMELVRAMNESVIGPESPPLDANGLPTMNGLDPCCGTGRFIIDALVFNEGLFMHGIDLDLWLLRAAMLNVRLLAKWTSCRFTGGQEQILHAFTKRSSLQLEEQGVSLPKEEPSNSLLIIGGRAIFMWGNALVLDTGYAPNWLCAGWAWSPHPWESNLKIRDYDGTLEQYQQEQGSIAPSSRDKVKFDFSMADHK